MAPAFLTGFSGSPGFRRLCREARGGVSVLGALTITSLVGMSGLAMEASQGYAEKVSDQRIADAAALAAALAYTAGDGDVAAVRPAAEAIAAVNGVPASGVEVAGPIPDGDARKLITVTIATEVPLHLTHVLTSALSYRVRAAGVAAVGSDAPPGDGGAGGCVIALSATAASGVALSGGTSITATDCAVSANAPIRLDGGATITAGEVEAGGAITRSGGTSITTTPKADQIFPDRPGAASDPLAGSAALAAALARADNPAAFIPPIALADPETPDDGAQDWTFDYNAQGAVQPFVVGGQWSGTYVVPPPPPGQSYRIRRLTIGGGVTVTFQGSSRVTISRGFTNGGKRLVIGDGSLWKVNGGFDTGSEGVSFGNSSLAIGQGTVKLNAFTIGDGDLLINATPQFGYGATAIGEGTHGFRGLQVGGGQTLTIGRGSFTSAGQVSVGGGGRLTITGGEQESIVIGDSGGTSIHVEGGSQLVFGPSKRFGTTGGITTLGGTNITFGATANHYVNGTMNLAGGAVFGSGAYTIRGDFTNVTGCGNCSMRGTDVSFFLSGRVILGGGSGLNMRAPETAVGEALPDILFATRTSLDTSLIEGADILLAGVWWSPNSAFMLDGGAKFSGAARCFTLIASTVTLAGGTAITGTGCPATSSSNDSGPQAVALVR